MSFPRYPKYKTSGVEWLGDVPEHWEVKKIGHIADLMTGCAFPSDKFGFDPETGIPLVRGDNVTEGWLRWGEKGRYWPLGYEYEKRYLLEANDIVIQMDGSKVGKNWAFVGDGDLPALLVQRVTRVRVNQAAHKFVYSLIANEMFVRYVDRAKTDPAIPHITMRNISDYWIPLPPLSEQTAIAAFLDRETGKIDELVAEQRRLMELLKEKRQAVISHAVTQGLNPQAPMKPSGIEWLGNVPEHWRVGKLGHVSKLRGGYAFSATDFGSEGIVVIKMNNLKRGYLDIADASRIPETSCNEGAALSEGDLLWGMSGSTGDTGSLGNYARVRPEDLPCQLNQRVGRFVADKSLLNLDFLEQIIQTRYFYEQIMLLVTGTAQSNVSSEQVQSCLLVLPPVSEQLKIVAFVAEKSAKFDLLTAEAQRAIDLLQERRTALISAAVTGQIDVRAIASN